MDQVTSKGFLRAFPGARQLESRALRELLACMRTIRVPESTTLFHSGDAGGPAYLILEGSVRVERRLATGRTVLLGRLGAGTIIGDMSLIDRSERVASVVIQQDLLAMCLEPEAYVRLREEAHPAVLWLLQEIDRDVAGRIRAMYDRLARLKDQPELAAEPDAPEVDEIGWLERVRDWVEGLR